MVLIEDLIAELKALTPDQLEQVARVVHEFAANSGPAETSPCAVSEEVLEQAVRNGWPRSFFTDVIGHIADDFERRPQPAYEVRPRL